MAVQGAVRKVELKHKFRLELDDFTRASFSKMGELKKTVAVVEVWEGGGNTPVKVPGRTTVEAVEVTRIAGMDEELYTWFQQVSNVHKNGGVVQDDFKKNGHVVQLDLNGDEIKTWEVRGVWPSDFSNGDWDNEADEGRAQSATLQMDDWDPIP